MFQKKQKKIKHQKTKMTPEEKELFYIRKYFDKDNAS